MCFTLNLSENGRNILGIFVAVLNVILFLSGISVALAGLVIQVHVNDELILLESFNSGMLPKFLVIVGTIMILLNMISAKIAYDSGFSVTRDKFRMTLLPLVVLMLLTSVVIMSAGITCLNYKSSVGEALHDGLMDSMRRYKSNSAVKVTLDKMQMFSRCCGSRSYNDWFMVSWIGIEYVDPEKQHVKRRMINGDYQAHNVPFSCCDVKSSLSCVTDQIDQSLKRKEKLTLYKVGCTDTLLDVMDNKILFPIGSFVMAVFGLQLLTAILLRYLETSIHDAYLEGDDEGPGKAYFCPECIPSCVTTADANTYARTGGLDKGRGALNDSESSDLGNNDTIVDMDGLPGIGDFSRKYEDLDDLGGGNGDKKKKDKLENKNSKSDKKPKKDKSENKKSKSEQKPKKDKSENKKSKSDKKPKKDKSPKTKKPKKIKKPKKEKTRKVKKPKKVKTRKVKKPKKVKARKVKKPKRFKARKVKKLKRAKAPKARKRMKRKK